MGLITSFALAVLAAVLIAVARILYNRLTRISIAYIRGPEPESFALGMLGDSYVAHAHPFTGNLPAFIQSPAGDVLAGRVHLTATNALVDGFQMDRTLRGRSSLQGALWGELFSTPLGVSNHPFPGGSSTHRRPQGHPVCLSNRRIPVPQTSRTSRGCFPLHWQGSSLGRRFALFCRARPFLNDSLLGANHRRQRKVMIPAFRSRESRSFVPIFNATAAKVPCSSVAQTRANSCL